MKQNQNARNKGRAKPSGRNKSTKSKNQSPGNRRDIKVKGNPKQLMDKYKTQAREAAQSGDRVQEEYYLQFADHYQRILNELYPPQQGRSYDDDESDDQDELEDGAEDQQSQSQQQGQQGQQGQQEDRQQNRRHNRQHGGHRRDRDRHRQRPSDSGAPIDPSEQEQPKMEYPEEMLQEIPKGSRRPEETDTDTGADSSVSPQGKESDDAQPMRRPRQRRADQAAASAVIVEQKPKRRGRPKKAESADSDMAPTLPLGDNGGDEAA